MTTLTNPPSEDTSYEAEFTILDWAAKRTSLIADGYKHDSPLIEGEVDRKSAEDGICPDCGKHLTFRPYRRLKKRVWDYMAYAVCEPCNKALII